MQLTPQSPAQIAREAKSFAQGLKETIQKSEKNELVNKDIDFQRRNLRTQYLRLLLLHPDVKESKDAENHLWMQTSYQFISKYKQRVHVLDQQIEDATNANGARRDGQPPHVEYRRVLNQFRQFLSEEEKFWVQLLQKYQHFFDLEEALPALKSLHLIVDQIPVEKGEQGRNIFPETGKPVPTPADQKESRLAVFTKLLVYLGDILRYKEQYNEANNRPRAGHEGGPSRRPGRGRRGGAMDNFARPRNYKRAVDTYKQAKLLSPDDGNASHQLAIIASYSKDTFSCILHYYRALCIRQPYDTASQNLNRALRKAMDEYKEKRAKQEEHHKPANHPELIERLKDWIIVLHALWSLDQDEQATKAAKQGNLVVTEFNTLVSDRVLPTDIINEVIVLALGALWKHRMIRNPAVSTIQNDIRREKGVETQMAIHILALHRSLLQTGIKELTEQTEESIRVENDLSRDLAQRITAVFRRTLPSLRIASKWLRTNIGYVEISASTPESLSDAIGTFWSSFVTFYNILSDAFPSDQLPNLKGPLEEDVDMNGFSPIRRLMLVPSTATGRGLNPGQSQVHPNEEQLMRISDLMKDAQMIAEIRNSPVKQRDGKFVLRSSADDDLDASGMMTPPVETLARIRESHPDPPRAVVRDSDDDNTTQTSRTDDDIVRDVFRATLDEIEIVWDPKPPRSPVAWPGENGNLSPHTLSPQLSNLSPPIIQSATTAQGLLEKVLGRSSIWAPDQGNGSIFPPGFSAHGSSRLPSVSTHSRSASHTRTSSLSQNWNNTSVGNSVYNPLSVGSTNIVNGGTGHSFGQTVSSSGGYDALPSLGYTSSTVQQPVQNQSTLFSLPSQSSIGKPSNGADYRLPYLSSPRETKVHPYNQYSTPIQRAYHDR